MGDMSRDPQCYTRHVPLTEDLGTFATELRSIAGRRCGGIVFGDVAVCRRSLDGLDMNRRRSGWAPCPPLSVGDDG